MAPRSRVASASTPAKVTVVRSIHTGAGHVEYTPIGHMTNLASRMQTAAPVGSIAVTEATRRLCEGYFMLKASRRHQSQRRQRAGQRLRGDRAGARCGTRLQRAAGRGLTKFVGREREMEVMRAAAESACAGRGQIVVAIAKAGTGKSRLFFEFKVTNQTGWMLLEAFSVSHGKASAYLPVIDLLHGYFRIASHDDARTRREKVNGKILTLDRAPDATRCLSFFGLLGIAEGEDPLARMDGPVKRDAARWTRSSGSSCAKALIEPLMVIFEDLHWDRRGDPGLSSTCSMPIRSAPRRSCCWSNYRPEYSAFVEQQDLLHPASARSGWARRARRRCCRRSWATDPILRRSDG